MATATLLQIALCVLVVLVTEAYKRVNPARWEALPRWARRIPAAVNAAASAVLGRIAGPEEVG